MFTVYLYEGEECIAQIQDIFEINADLKLNGSSQVKITLDAQSPYIQKDLLRMWRSIRITELTEEGEKEMLAGVIRWVEANFTQVEIIAESRRVLLEKRLVDQKHKWNQAPLEEVVRILFEEQNRKSPLPFNIECETGSTVSLEVGEKAVLSSVINSLIKEGVDVFLIGDTLKIGKHIWEDRTQGANYKEFRYDTQDPEGNTIDKAKLVIDAKEMSNKVWGQRSEESIARYGLLEESKSNEDEATYLKEHKEQVSEFNITVGEDSFYQVELGDKVKVIIKGYNELMQFNGVMKIVGKKYRSGDLPTIEYTVSTQRIPQEWVIGTIKQLSEKVNQKTISTTWPQADLSGYATSSAVSSAIQSQNKKIEQKADSSFVQWVAQTAQTALNTANQAKQTADGKANDSDVVHKGWSETLDWAKTFSGWLALRDNKIYFRSHWDNNHFIQFDPSAWNWADWVKIHEIWGFTFSTNEWDVFRITAPGNLKFRKTEADIEVKDLTLWKHNPRETQTISQYAKATNWTPWGIHFVDYVAATPNWLTNWTKELRWYLHIWDATRTFDRFQTRGYEWFDWNEANLWKARKYIRLDAPKILLWDDDIMWERRTWTPTNWAGRITKHHCRYKKIGKTCYFLAEVYVSNVYWNTPWFTLPILRANYWTEFVVAWYCVRRGENPATQSRGAISFSWRDRVSTLGSTDAWVFDQPWDYIVRASWTYETE